MGFTLLEVLVALGILSVLAALLLPSLGELRHQALKAQTRLQFERLRSAVLEFRAEYGHWPRVAPAGVLETDRVDSALAGRSRGDEPAPGEGELLNQRSIQFFHTEPWDRIFLRDGSARLVDAFGNAEIGFMTDEDFDGRIVGDELVARPLRAGNPKDGWRRAPALPENFIPPTGIEASVAWYSPGRGEQPSDYLASWR